MSNELFERITALEAEEDDAHDTISRLQRELHSTRTLLEQAQKQRASDDDSPMGRELTPLTDVQDGYVLWGRSKMQGSQLTSEYTDKAERPLPLPFGLVSTNQSLYSNLARSCEPSRIPSSIDTVSRLHRRPVFPRTI